MPRKSKEMTENLTISEQPPVKNITEDFKKITTRTIKQKEQKTEDIVVPTEDIVVPTEDKNKPEDKPNDKPDDKNKPEDKPNDKPDDKNKPEDKPNDKPDDKDKPVKKEKKTNAWIEHCKNVKKLHPGMLYCDVLKVAKESYKK